MNNFVKFTAANGFSMWDQAIDWKDGETEEQWLTRIGFESFPSHEGLECEREAIGVMVHYAKADDAVGYAIVSPTDYDKYEYILVANPADLIELRLRLLPWHGVAVMRRFESLADLAEKAFTAWHGHESGYPCPNCDPREYQRVQEFTREQDAREAAWARKQASEPKPSGSPSAGN